MKKMTEVLKIGILGICLAVIAGTVYAGSVCTCEDWDEDGRFGVVLYHTVNNNNMSVVKSNIGNYYQCISFKSGLDICSGKTNLCACEDWDKDGRFGVVLYNGLESKKPTVLKPNMGNFYECTSFKSSLSQCP